MPLVNRALVWSLEERAQRLTPVPLPKADAVLVLRGGLRPALAPRRGVEVGEAGDRLLTGVALRRQGQAPMLVVSGGRVGFTAADPAPPESGSAIHLAQDPGMSTTRILANRGRRVTAPCNTAEEAEALAQLAAARHGRSVLLVTSATQLPRAVAGFRRH
ncbi:MAG: YdcF family protein [Cyanobium sp.]